MVEKAIEIVTKAFDGKTDKAGRPYVEHLWRVQQNVKKYEDPAVEVVALLHDLLEDCPEWDTQQLRELFPDSIVTAVEHLTHRSDESYEDYIEKIRTHELARRVKIADLEDNMNLTRLPQLTEKDWYRVQKYHASYKKLTMSSF